MAAIATQTTSSPQNPAGCAPAAAATALSGMPSTIEPSAITAGCTCLGGRAGGDSAGRPHLGCDPAIHPGIDLADDAIEERLDDRALIVGPELAVDFRGGANLFGGKR